MHFKAAGNVVGELEHAYRLEDTVLKFLTVFISKNAPKLQKQFVELAEQAGPEFVAEFGSGS